MELKELVKQARGDRTQAEVAEQLGVTPQAVSQWETGANEPSIANLKKLGIEIRYLIEEGPTLDLGGSDGTRKAGSPNNESAQ